jgi:hypothetical protein
MAACRSSNNSSNHPKQIGGLASVWLGFFLLAAFVLLIGCGESSLFSIIINPNTSSVGVNQAQNFTALGRDGAGILIGISPTWSVTGNIGTVSTSGLFIAGNTAGVGTVAATANGITGSAIVTVTENGWISGRLTSSLGSVSGIRIYLLELGTVDAFADINGFYTISSVPPGTYIVQTVATTVYQSSSQEVSVTRGQTRTGIDFILQLQPSIPIIPTTTIPL